jgi:hypothetical protein
MKVSELLSIVICNQMVMDILAAMDVGKFPPKTRGGATAGGQQVVQE